MGKTSLLFIHQKKRNRRDHSALQKDIGVESRQTHSMKGEKTRNKLHRGKGKSLSRQEAKAVSGNRIGTVGDRKRIET